MIFVQKIHELSFLKKIIISEVNTSKYKQFIWKIKVDTSKWTIK